MDGTFRKQNRSDYWCEYWYWESISRGFSKEGAHVLALDISDQLEETVQSINDNGGKATAYRVDISDDKQVKQFSEK